jgi:type VI secretion system protein VasD
MHPIHLAPRTNATHCINALNNALNSVLVSALNKVFAALITTLLAAVFALAPLGSAQAQAKEPTVIELTIEARPDVNPDDKGTAKPVKVRIYELKNEASFEAADYFTLDSTDKATLAADLLAKDEFILRPGESKIIRKKSHPDTVAIGILAGYRDLAGAVWRVTHKLEPAPEAAWYRMVIPANKAKLSIKLQAGGIMLTETK